MHFFPLDAPSVPKDSTNTYAECVYRALRTNPQPGCGCEPPRIPSPCLGPVSRAAAGQRWVTRPVNDTSRLGHKLEQTEVRGRRPVILGWEDYEAVQGVQLCAGFGCVFVCVQGTACISDSGSARYAAHVLG